jgi:hypothetical protein
MKISFLTLLLSFSISSYSQNLTGALETDAATYKLIGQAPLPQGSNIPLSVDLSSRMPPVGDQNPQLSCVAWATTYAAYSYMNKQSNTCNYLNGNGSLNTDCLFSPAFVYNQINGGINRGTKYEDAFRVMVNQGNAPMTAMPYIPNDFQHQPSVQTRQLAENYKIDSYWQLGMSEDIFLETKAYLAKGIPVIAAAKVDNYFRFRPQSNYPNPYVWTNWSGQIDPMMGHAILIVGYDDNTGRFKFINSWGTNWGNLGYGYISYNMYRNGAVSQAWIIKTKNSSQSSSIVLARESKTINNADILAGLNFTINHPSFFTFPKFPSPQEYFSALMTFSGFVSIPAGLGQNSQVVIYFYYDNNGQKGDLVTSVNYNTRTLKGQAVISTYETPIPQNSNFKSPITLRIAYADLGVLKGYPNGPITTRLIAEPVLLIDNFPVRIGRLLPFVVSL